MIAKDDYQDKKRKRTQYESTAESQVMRCQSDKPLWPDIDFWNEDQGRLIFNPEVEGLVTPYSSFFTSSNPLPILKALWIFFKNNGSTPNISEKSWTMTVTLNQ